MRTLYDAFKEAGCEIDNHYSDLYVCADDKARQVLRDYRAATPKAQHPIVSSFISNIDGKMWFDFPFCFTPYWEAKRA